MNMHVEFSNDWKSHTLKIIPTSDAHIYPDKIAFPQEAIFRETKYQYIPCMLGYRHVTVVGIFEDLQ